LEELKRLDNQDQEWEDTAIASKTKLIDSCLEVADDPQSGTRVLPKESIKKGKNFPRIF
jgi:hypothetical protein